MNKEKIRVAFLILGSAKWLGGLHYTRNLLYAISVLDNKKIEPYVFVGSKVDESSVAHLRPFAKIIRTPIIDKKSIRWWLWRIISFLTGSNCIINPLFREHNIQVVSHSDIVDKYASYKTINWIPDLQHIHLPGMFSFLDIFTRNKKYTTLVKNSDAVIVSSNDAAKDVKSFIPGYDIKINTLRFVSQPAADQFKISVNELQTLQKKYLLKGMFFYLPNQFWKHKNHSVVFKAVNILKEQGKEIVIACSGHMNDYRNPVHVSELNTYILDHNLEKNIRLLGLIDYSDVFMLMRHSLAVINPSLFEGWSSTVEEAKSMGKGMILSQINVHTEQDPPASEYFSPHDPEQLADILGKYWEDKEVGPDLKLEEQAQKNLSGRTHDFGHAYQKIVLSL